jgi:glycosyltransferase involved in cell wall biosynthesis
VRTRQEIVIKRLLRTISRVLTRDVFEEQWFLARGVPPERLHRVGPADSVGAPVAQRLPHSTGIGQQIKIGYVGELAAEGGAPFFLSALALVQGLGKEWEAFVIGDGSARPGLEQLCVQLHLDGRVAFLGRLRPEEVHNRMGACTVLVVAADVPCGYSLLAEATTLGIGVIIVSRIPAASASDVVQDGSGVLVYQPGDVLQLANAIESVMQLRQRPAATSDAGREHSASRSSATFARHLENAVRAAVR